MTLHDTMQDTGFFKAFTSMLDSSVWIDTNSDVKVLWFTLLFMADKNGFVEAALPGLAHRSTLSLESTIKSLEVLMSPDEFSKSPDEEGRRVLKVDGGWKIVNFIKYRDKWVGQKKRADGAIRQKNYVLRKKAGLPPAKRGRPPASPPPPNPETESPEY